MAMTKGSGGSGGGSITRPPSWYQGGKKNVKGKGAAAAAPKSTGWTDEAKKAYGGRYGKQQDARLPGQVPAWLNFEGLGQPTSLGGTYAPTVPASVRNVVPGSQQRTVLSQPPGFSGGSFIGGGGNAVRGFGGQALNLAQYQQAINNMNDARERRIDYFGDLAPGGAADADVGNIELGNWIGDYIRSLYTVPPPINDTGGGGGYDWWGRRRGGGGGGFGYGAGYNPSWSTGLFQLNANR